MSQEKYARIWGTKNAIKRMANQGTLATPNGHHFGTALETILATTNRLENRTPNGVGLLEENGLPNASPNGTKTRRTQDAPPGDI